MKTQNLQDQVVWITGASSGIGQALAIIFAELGMHLILSARRDSELQRVKALLANQEKHICIPLDITNAAQIEQALQQVLTEKGRIDWLINNAGLSQRALIQDTSMDTERKIMEVDYFAQVAMTKAVLPTLLKQKSGRVVFISSVAGLIGTQYRATYSAAKAAIHMWANSLRAEVAAQGIHVAVVFPGFVKTNVSLNALTGNGEAQGFQDEAIEQGLDADEFAQQTVKALLQNQEYIVIGGRKEKLGVMLSRLSPSILYKQIRKVQVK